jgi:hypothetical protein
MVVQTGPQGLGTLYVITLNFHCSSSIMLYRTVLYRTIQYLSTSIIMVLHCITVLRLYRSTVRYSTASASVLY